MKSDIRNLDLNLLKALDALLDGRSVTGRQRGHSPSRRCGSSLACATPLMTRCLSALHGMVPTLRAQALAAPVKQLLTDAETLLQPVVFDPLEADFTWTIAATDYALKAVIVPLSPR